MISETHSSGHSHHFEQREDGSFEEVYPCRCGQTHRGEYAIYDYGHHECFHNEPLWLIDFWTNAEGKREMHWCCAGCGKDFYGVDDGGADEDPLLAQGHTILVPKPA